MVVTAARTPDLLTAVVDAIVPADDYPSASASGGLDFLRRIRDNERPDWGRRMNAVVAKVDAAAWRAAGTGFIGLDPNQREAVLAGLDDDPDLRWFARLVNFGYYGASTSSAQGASATSAPNPAWAMIDWQPGPQAGWPEDRPELPFARGLITAQQLRPQYDAVVVGSGAGGGTVAQVLAESGRTVLIIEAGDGPPADRLAHDHLRSPRLNIGLEPLTGWSQNASTVGGGTRVFGAQAWRFSPQDFRMATEYGVPEDSSLADWPISYDDLEPYYSEAEWRFGVSGSATGDPWAGPRSRDFPMPPLSGIGNPALLAAAATRLGWETLPVPLLINSVEYGGRSGCLHCAQCVGFACPIEAKSGSHNTAIPAAMATGRGFLITGTTAERLITDRSGHLTGVALVGEIAGTIWRAEVAAGDVIIAAGATESARLLLSSTSDAEPNGIGNNHDQVGRNLQGHLYGGALGLFEDEVFPLEGPGASIATCDFRHGNPGLVGGGMIANEFVPTPASIFDYLTTAGVFPPYGAAAKDGMRRWTRRMQRVVGPIQEIPSAAARVRLDPQQRDRYGNPVATFSGSVHPLSLQSRDFLTSRAAEWLEAAGASRVLAAAPGSKPTGPSAGQHQAGTCRMGTDPATSVTDPYGRVWGHDNLRVADGSLHVTNGGVNPVLSILAGALRVAQLMVGAPIAGSRLA
jgi:choline dehydrogenase-like flavoprotein